MIFLILMALIIGSVGFIMATYLWSKLSNHMIEYNDLLRKCIQMADILGALTTAEREQKIVNVQLLQEYQNTIEILKKITLMLNSPPITEPPKDEMN